MCCPIHLSAAHVTYAFLRAVKIDFRVLTYFGGGYFEKKKRICFFSATRICPTLLSVVQQHRDAPEQVRVRAGRVEVRASQDGRQLQRPKADVRLAEHPPRERLELRGAEERWDVPGPPLQHRVGGSPLPNAQHPEHVLDHAAKRPHVCFGAVWWLIGRRVWKGANPGHHRSIDPPRQPQIRIMTGELFL